MQTAYFFLSYTNAELSSKMLHPKNQTFLLCINYFATQWSFSLSPIFDSPNQQRQVAKKSMPFFSYLFSFMLAKIFFYSFILFSVSFFCGGSQICFCFQIFLKNCFVLCRFFLSFACSYFFSLDNFSENNTKFNFI